MTKWNSTGNSSGCSFHVRNGGEEEFGGTNCKEDEQGREGFENRWTVQGKGEKWHIWMEHSLVFAETTTLLWSAFDSSTFFLHFGKCPPFCPRYHFIFLFISLSLLLPPNLRGQSTSDYVVPNPIASVSVCASACFFFFISILFSFQSDHLRLQAIMLSSRGCVGRIHVLGRAASRMAYSSSASPAGSGLNFGEIFFWQTSKIRNFFQNSPPTKSPCAIPFANSWPMKSSPWLLSTTRRWNIPGRSSKRHIHSDSSTALSLRNTVWVKSL